jgi:hypothetical protein
LLQINARHAGKKIKQLCNPNQLQMKMKRKNLENWRPITLTGAMYRITFITISNYLQIVNEIQSSRIISSQQKGFINNVKGDSDHISKISMLLAHAVTHKKSIYIAAIDCKDAF